MAAASSQPLPLRVGTLSYTPATLLTVFFWMLWGDLCVNIVEQVLPRLVPLQLDGLGAGKFTIGFVSASVGAATEFAFTPFFSTFSDRYRSRLGRRRPFILLGTPLLAACFAALGVAVPAGRHAAEAIGVSPKVLTITLIGLLLAILWLFNVIVLAAYYYLIADVIPRRVIGTFTSLYKLMGAVGGMAFNKWVYPHADEQHMPRIYLGCALVFLVAFLLMGWRVKEGAYPPPPSTPAREPLSAAAQWARECFAVRFYQKLYLIGLCYYFTIGSSVFIQFYALDDLHLTKQQFGDANFYAALIALPLYFVLGPLSDRFHPLRVLTIGIALMGLSGLGSYFFIHDVWSFYVWNTANMIGQTVYLGSQISLLPRLFPHAAYGQYCSANNTLCALGKFGAPALCGYLIGRLASNPVAYLWQAAFAVAGLVACWQVYAHWQKLGGDAGYAPPIPETTVADAALTAMPLA